MLISLDCIALRMVRYNDRTSILTVYTRQRGRMSLAIPASASRSAARIRALVQPMALFECSVDLRPDREIQSPRNIRSVVLPPSGNPLGAVQAMFSADLLSGLLRETQSDPVLFGYLAGAARILSAATSAPGGTPLLANYHIALMLGLTRLTGIEPDWSTYTPGCVFDMAEGVFKSFQPAHTLFLTAREAEGAYRLRRLTFANAARWRFGRADRNLIIDRLTAYYQIHFTALKSLFSTEVLRHTFDF